MSTLFDALKKSLAAAGPTAAQPEQQQIQAALAAKTGKAPVVGGGPKASNLGEAQAAAQAQAQGEQIALAGVGAAADLTTQEQNLRDQETSFDASLASENRRAVDDMATRSTTVHEGLASREGMAAERRTSEEGRQVSAINAGASQRLKEMATSKRIAVDDIFAEFESNEKDLEYRKDAAELEQLGFLLALGDRTYVDELNRVGNELALQDELNYREEMYRLTFGNELNDLTDKLQWQSKYNADERDYTKSLANIDAGAALSLAEAAIRDGNRQAAIEGATSAVREGADIYGKQEPTKPAARPKPTNSNPTQHDSGYPVLEN